MEISQIALNQGLTFLVWATGVVLIVVAGFLVVNTELKPTLQELNQTLSSINEIVKNTDKGVGDFKSAVAGFIDKTKAVSGTMLGGLFNGFTTVYKMFKK